jgi:hypothetical protein
MYLKQSSGAGDDFYYFKTRRQVEGKNEMGLPCKGILVFIPEVHTDDVGKIMDARPDAIND